LELLHGDFRPSEAENSVERGHELTDAPRSHVDFVADSHLHAGSSQTSNCDVVRSLNSVDTARAVRDLELLSSWLVGLTFGGIECVVLEFLDETDFVGWNPEVGRS